ncbi:hypothetical protein [Nocardioides convexus]|nr:hypothetical protein [Nocardioides convexus]
MTRARSTAAAATHDHRAAVSLSRGNASNTMAATMGRKTIRLSTFTSP